MFTTDPATTAQKVSAGKTTLSQTNATAVYVTSTKAGLNTVTAKSGDVSATFTFFAENAATDYYKVAVSPATLSLAAGAYGKVTVTVTDIYGNPVNTGDDLTATAKGSVLLGGLNYTQTVNTGADGTADLTVIGNNSAGTGTVSIAPAAATPTNAWAATYVVPSGAPTGTAAPVSTGSVTVTVTGAPTTATTDAATTSKINDIATAVANLSTTVAGLVASLVAQIKDTKAAIADTKAALDKLAAVVAKIQKKVKA